MLLFIFSGYLNCSPFYYYKNELSVIHCFILYVLTVKGEFICTYLRNHPTADLAALIIKEEDSNTEAELKRLFSTMMAFDPSARPSIQHVIDTLSDIQTSLGKY